MRLGIRWKFSTFMAGLLAATVVLLSWLVLNGIERNQRARMEASLGQKSEIANLYIRQSYLSEPLASPDSFLKGRGPSLAAELTPLVATGVALYDMGGNEIGSTLASGSRDVRDTLDYVRQGYDAYQTTGNLVLYFAPLRISGKQIGMIGLSYSLDKDREFLASMQSLFLRIGVVVVAASALIGFLYFSRFAAALHRLRKAADQIRVGQYLDEQPVKSRDELGDLGESVLYMSREIERNFGRQKRFIGSVSHEFKTPLTSIRAYADLLEMYGDDPALLREAAGNIAKETDRLHDMVEKVLRMSALEHYEFDSNAKPLEVQEALADMCARMQGLAARSGIAIHTDLEPVVIWADSELFEHIFMNLLNNAVKYNTEGGHVYVRCREKDGQVNISVRDTGIGIPEEAKDRLFEPFYTVSKSRSRLSGGTGLGLSVAKQMAEIQGGSVKLAATGPEGSEFVLTFPSYRGGRQEADRKGTST
ncbi:two-component sensor histidine kinase [Paenibacillus cisolokensis]|uniref:histidine kinase n=1 Tax=Paenibacillus cisolokensis TaxID=1658519 RepID=A0ABQ4N7Q4_9BACL|nr:HAMP domain-containing sensor histidine kinase [Paenibacillus cisolokensis]GIQ64229.1 two-component sensor histidine kinase [Paenibacillus cisolokensis]